MVRWTPDRAVRILVLAGPALCCVLDQDSGGGQGGGRPGE